MIRKRWKLSRKQRLKRSNNVTAMMAHSQLEALWRTSRSILLRQTVISQVDMTSVNAMPFSAICTPELYVLLIIIGI